MHETDPVSGRPGDASQQIAETTSQPEPSEPAAGTGTGAAGAETGPNDIQLASVSEEELAIGLAYETLADLEVIENLELLELHQRLDSLLNLPPEEREQIRENAQRFEQMSPEQKERLREQMRQLRALPPEERLELLDHVIGDE